MNTDRCGRALAAAVRGGFLAPLAIAGSVLQLVACTTLLPPQTQAQAVAVEVPKAWSADAAGGGALAVGDKSLAAWWQRFEDPLLSDLVNRALQANTRIVAAQAALRQARALRDVAAAGLWPTLSSSASAQHGTSGGHSNGNNFRVGLDANWGLDVFGARRAGVDASDAATAASAASLGDVQVQVAAEVALNYILLRTAQARLRIANGNLDSLQETLQIARWRLQAGLVSALDAEQARAAVAQNRAQLPVLQTSIVQTRNALALLTAQPPAALLALTEPSAANHAVPQLREALVLSIPAETLRQRADVRAAEHQVAAALARTDQAQAQRWPSFSVAGSLGLSALTLGALGSTAALASSVLASVSLPLFDGGAARAQVRAQQAALDQAGQVYKAAVLGALKDVEDALAALRGDRLRLQSLRSAAEAAEQAMLIADQRYRSGLVDFQAVLETQRTLRATQDGLVGASADLSSDQVRLYTALGGGWRSTDIQDQASSANKP